MINLIGQKVVHKTFGEGIVTEYTKTEDDNYFNFSVSFANKKCEFSYPSSFEKFLTAVDSDIQNEINRQLESIRSTNRLMELIQKVQDLEKQKELEKKLKYSDNGAHIFSFDGGRELTDMGASWFVSYCYFTHVDKTHVNWKKIKTVQTRKNTYKNTKKYHTYWLKKILQMSENQLSTNKIELSGKQVKEMAKKLLDILS